MNIRTIVAGAGLVLALGCGTHTPTESAFSCHARAASYKVGALAHFSATPIGSYEWRTNDASPMSGYGFEFSTRFRHPGMHTVRVEDGSVSATCRVQITE